MPLKASEYAKLLGEKIEEHDVNVYLINTGWSGGPYGIGRRIDLKYTRTMVSAAIKGDLEKVSYDTHEIFNLQYPTSCKEIPSALLNPKNTWHDKTQYDFSAKRLAKLFIKNFKKFEPVSEEILKAGPVLD